MPIAQSKVSFCSLLALPCPFPPTPSSSPNPFPPRAASLFCVTMLLFLFCLLNYFVHPIPYRSQIIWYLFSSDWFISHYIIIIGSTMLSQKGKYTSFFLWWSIIPLGKYTSSFIHSFTDGHLGCL